MTIYFYSTKEAYGEFSNFAPFPINVDGKEWPTSEHYFQAQKFTDLSYQEKIRLTKSPMIAARLGRSRKIPIKSNWEEIKDDIMLKAVREKIVGYKALTDLLLSTKDNELIEKTTKDHYWGCGSNGNGKNMLGIILMTIRKEIKIK